MKLLALIPALSLINSFASSPYQVNYEKNHGICNDSHEVLVKRNSDEQESFYWILDHELENTSVTKGFTEQDQEKLKAALEIISEIVNTPDFKNRVLNHTWKGKKQFNQNNGLSNTQIYEKIMSGEERLNPGIDHEMDFDLELYRSWNPFSGVLGYTNPDTTRIWLNKKFYRKASYTASDVAANLIHEWIHKIGFGHSFNYNDDRPYSVPYAIGNILGELAQELGYE